MQISQTSPTTAEVQGDNQHAGLTIFATPELLVQMQQDICIQQGINITSLPGLVKNALVMPDAHQGYGFPIGGVAAMDMHKGCVSPGGVGFDINCGMRMLISSLTYKDVQEKIPELLDMLYKKVPVGMGRDSDIRLSHEELDEVLEGGMKWALEKGFATAADLDVVESGGHMKNADASLVSPRAKKRGRFQLGTLGSGNHFLEIQKVDEVFNQNIAKTYGLQPDQIVVMIHCGSRGIGHQVCSDFIQRIENEFPELVDALPERDLAYAPITSPCAQEYLKAMACAMNFAWANRQVITARVRECFDQLFDSELTLLYDMSHNTAKIETHTIDGKPQEVCVHRKGAARAFGPGSQDLHEKFKETGQPVLIPGSMGTASYVLAGTKEGMLKSFGSTCHGAGRTMSRKKAGELFSVEGVTKDLADKNISYKAASDRGMVSEAPGVYKDVDEVVKVCADAGLAKIVARVVPIGVLKG